MAWLILDEAGEIVAIDQEFDPELRPVPAEQVIECAVPEAYPECMRWDPEAAEFVDDLTALKEAARRRVDESAGAFRSTYLTAIPGQETIYTIKAQQAQSFLAAFAATGGTVEPDPEAWPYVHAEALACTGAATAATLKERAELILAAAAQIAAALPLQEALRVARKEAITAATSVAEIEALAEVDWAAALSA